MPSPLLDAFVDALPRITAEESLISAQVTAVGSGSLRRGAGRQIISAWQRQAGQRGQVVRPRGRAMYDAQMAMSGIGVQRVKREAADA